MKLYKGAYYLIHREGKIAPIKFDSLGEAMDHAVKIDKKGFDEGRYYITFPKEVEAFFRDTARFAKGDEK